MCYETESKIVRRVKREWRTASTRSETLCMYLSIPRGNREILLLDTGGAVFRVGNFKEVIQR